MNRTVHTAEHLASVAFALGVEIVPIPRAGLTAAESPLQGKYAVLHPFASSSDKCWPADRFCELARYLNLWNITPVFLAGPGRRRNAILSASASSASRWKAPRPCFSRAAFFVGNDSGPAHIAAAFGVPSVVLFGPSKPAIWGPWRTESEIIVAPEGLPSVSVSRVVAALERLRVLQEAHA